MLNGDVAFHFKNGLFTSSSGIKYNSGGLDTRSVTSLEQLRKLFLAAAAKDSFSAQTSLKDSCLAAEFGYYNPNIDSSGPAPKLIKVWKVTPADREYPVAFIRDDNATLLSYFNGIVTFN